MNDLQLMNDIALLRTEFTPDIAELDFKKFHLLFVCDDVMRAGKNYRHIAEYSARVVRAYTQQKFSFYRHRTDGQGVTILPRKQPTNRYDFSALRIKGEVHAVQSDALINLDRHYENGVQFKRMRMKILYAVSQHGVLRDVDVDGRPLPRCLQGNNHNKHVILPERVDPIEVWMYVGKYSYWSPLLDGGFAFEQVPIKEPEKDRSWLLKYYQFNNR